MPMFFYLPMIFWLGMCGVVQAELRAPVKVKAEK
jgi:hypothetical protein